MLKVVPLITLLAAVALSACDYSIVETPGLSNNGGAVVSIVVNPGVATVKPGDTVQFSAVVSGATDTSVRWSIDSGIGEIRPDGVFVAPASTSISTTTVRARANADSTKSSTAVVTIDP